MAFDMENLASQIEVSALTVNTVLSDIKKACEIATSYHCFGTCVNPCYLTYSLKNTIGFKELKHSTVVGYPDGAELTAVKVYAAKQAELMGADEINIVINMSAFLSGNLKYAKQDIDALCSSYKLPVNVMLEASFWDETHLLKAAELVSETSAAALVTSTGFFKRTTTPQMVQAIKSIARADLAVHAAGEIKTLAELQELGDAGAERFCLSHKNAIEILHEADAALGRESLV